MRFDVKIGDLRRKITIQETLLALADDSTQDSFGQHPDTWVTFATVWAKVAPKSGREFLANQQLQNEVNTIITIRYLADVKCRMRVYLDGIYYDIKDIINLQQNNQWLILGCQELVSNV